MYKLCIKSIKTALDKMYLQPLCELLQCLDHFHVLPVYVQITKRELSKGPATYHIFACTSHTKR